MYPVGDAQLEMYLVGDGGGEEDLCHLPSGGRSVRNVPSGDGRAEEDLCHVLSGGSFPRFSIIPHSYCEHTI